MVVNEIKNITNDVEIEFTLGDFKEDVQKQLCEMYPDNNWDIFPICSLFIQGDADE